ncbi:serine/threonine-protein kinase Nek4 isoform X2 [Zootoca vivipara]|uniref:serine/threonine-protein kinase Nek4 isoform X2 n=1 Tax=Zootoca vivipara TaxID=8524 RepID=UPI00293B9535|nr:serine/threonine-protein kinase Nek4 isoform X2 [Zootoca vivipara]
MPVGEYAFVRPVGKGSYGEVSLVRHRQDNKQYVIKRLNLKHASSRERKSAEQEAQLLSQLKHPNIVTYRESWEGEDGLLYIVMGFCEGGDLYHKLKEQKGKLLPESQVVEWFVQIAMALQYLHERHILHRDLKTQNVFLTRSNIIKVGDLGIARVLENQYDMASTLIGTPYYMSPELFSNKPYNYKSDVWALGCCAYEMATLKHAFNAKDMNSLVYRIIEGKLPPMPKDYSMHLKELIRTMLSKKPEERPSVRSVLRQPYIKHQISLFLEATKAKTAKNHKKMTEVKPQSSSGNAELKNGNVTPQKLPNEHSRKSKRNEEKCLIHNKTFQVSSSNKLAPEPEKSANTNGLNSTDMSVATMSKVDIVIVPLEKRNSESKQPLAGTFTGDKKPRSSSMPSEAESEIGINAPQCKEERLQSITNPCLETVAIKKGVIDTTADGDDTMKLLQPVSEIPDTNDKAEASFRSLGEANSAVQNESTPRFQPQGSVHEPSLSRQQRQKKREQLEDTGPRPLPAAPDMNAKTRGDNTDKQDAAVTRAINRPGSTEVTASKDRPLSARERRRLKQSQEDMLPFGPAARRASHSAAIETKLPEDGHVQIAHISSELGICETKSLIGCSTEDELSSSTSSTERSDGDSKEGKTNEMHDLVQLMTQTLKMDNKENCSQSAILAPETQFRLNRKYKDTLKLHGKASEEPDEFQLQEFPSDVLSGHEKVRRLVEILRADVVQGLGVKLLEKVYDVMDEEDEQKRELHLRKLMGEKYTSYSIKARHLKFLEENVKL